MTQPVMTTIAASAQSAPEATSASGDRTILLRHAHDVVVVEPRQTVHPCARRRLADVHHGQHLVLAVREEVGVDALGVEAGHRAGRQPRGAYADDEVANLQGAVEP